MHNGNNKKIPPKNITSVPKKIDFMIISMFAISISTIYKTFAITIECIDMSFISVL